MATPPAHFLTRPAFAFRTQAWAEYVWTRLRRMDYWNAAHIPTNTAARLYRWNAPGLRAGGRPEATLSKLDAKLETSNFSVCAPAAIAPRATPLCSFP